MRPLRPQLLIRRLPPLQHPPPAGHHESVRDCASARVTGSAGLDIERLYHDCLPRVYAFALRMLGDREAALDVAQESFAIALARADSFRGDSSPQTWLFSIARHLCLRRLRGARARSFDDFEAIIAQHAEEPSTAHLEIERRVYVDEVKEGCLVGLLQCLPFSQRCVFVLHLLNDLPIADVGAIMGRATTRSGYSCLGRVRGCARSSAGTAPCLEGAHVPART